MTGRRGINVGGVPAPNTLRALRLEPSSDLYVPISSRYDVGVT